MRIKRHTAGRYSTQLLDYREVALIAYEIWG